VTQPHALKVDRNIKTLRQLTLEKLREAIIGFQFQPGDRLIERELCEQLGVSRSIVREVLRNLESEGLVQMPPHSGPVVSRPTPAEAQQIYEIRSLLEGLAARACAEAKSAQTVAALLDKALAAIRRAYARNGSSIHVVGATTPFYRTLFEGGGKMVAWEIVSSLNARINHLRAMTILTPGRSIEGPRQLAAIVEAIRKGDGEAAFQACIEHVGRASEIAQQLLSDDTKR
jgi:DNA-binding GntR family transcriptional regulator